MKDWRRNPEAVAGHEREIDARAAAREAHKPQNRLRVDEYRDLLEAWCDWWNNIGRYHFTSYVRPPLTATGEALACLACHNLTELDIENGPDRCEVCARRLP